MAQYVKVEDNPNLVRDSFSKAVLNKDTSGLAAYRAARDRTRKQEDAVASINTLNTRMDSMESKLERLIKLIEDNRK